jgi:hypothetical protein
VADAGRLLGREAAGAGAVIMPWDCPDEDPDLDFSLSTREIRRRIAAVWVSRAACRARVEAVNVLESLLDSDNESMISVRPEPRLPGWKSGGYAEESESMALADLQRLGLVRRR